MKRGQWRLKTWRVAAPGTVDALVRLQHCPHGGSEPTARCGVISRAAPRRERLTIDYLPGLDNRAGFPPSVKPPLLSRQRGRGMAFGRGPRAGKSGHRVRSPAMPPSGRGGHLDKITDAQRFSNQPTRLAHVLQFQRSKEREMSYDEVRDMLERIHDDMIDLPSDALEGEEKELKDWLVKLGDVLDVINRQLAKLDC